MNIWRKLWADFKELLEGKPGYIQFVIGPFKPSTGTVAPTPQFNRSPIHGEVTVSFNLPADKKVTLSIAPKDSKGNPAKIDGVPVWATDTPTVLALTPAADGLSCLVEPVGMLTPGDGSKPAQVQVNVDADLGPGVTELVGTLAIDVSAGSATVIDITPGPLQ